MLSRQSQAVCTFFLSSINPYKPIYFLVYFTGRVEAVFITKTYGNLDFKLNVGEVIPLLLLPSNKDKEISTWDMKQSKHLVLFFNHGVKCNFCRQKLKSLAAVYPRLKALDTEVFAISSDSISELKEQAAKDSIEFPLLSDTNHSYTEKFTQIDYERNSPYPSIFVTDRYGELRLQEIKPEADQLMDENRIISRIYAIEIECPECSHM